MQVHRDILKLPVFKKAVVTIGTFDGVHGGHRIIIDQLTARARETGGESVIITFNPHPRRIIGNQQSEIRLINTVDERIELLGKLGVDHLVIIPFTSSFAALSAIEYVEHFLVQYFHPSALIIGYDHRFGRNREGNYQLLEALKEKFHFDLIEIPGKLLHDITISSTRIRTFIINNQVARANELLGYAYFFEGTIIKGNQLGRTIGFPTANLQMNDAEKLIPGNGVYAVKVYWKGNPAGHQMPGMMNIGVRPTVDGTRLMIEVNIFDFDQEIYGETLRVEVVEYLRGEQKFSGLDALKQQLQHDRLASQRILERTTNA